MLQLVCNSVVSHPPLLCHKSITKTYRRQEVQRLFCRKNTDFFKKSPPFYRNQSVTSSPKTSQLCCTSRQNKPSATVCTHFRERSDAFRFAYHCIYMHSFVYHGFCVRFCGATPYSLLCSFPMESKLELLCSVRHNSSLLKSTKRGRCTKMCNGLSQFRLCY